MTSVPDRRAPAAQAEIKIHKKKYFSASRTWDVWNKLTARDVFALTQMPHFEGIVLFAIQFPFPFSFPHPCLTPCQHTHTHDAKVRCVLPGQHVYFHHNHPIQYVYLCGLVQQFELAPGAGAARYALLMLDDGSGRAIEVKIPRRYGPELTTGEVYPSNTLIDNLNVYDTWGLASLFINNKPIHVGTVLKIKGTIAEFRERQVELKRVFLVKDTNEEVAFWAGVAKHRRDVLSRPWVLSSADMKFIDDQVDSETRKEVERKNARRAKYKVNMERKAENDEKRQRQAEKKRQLFDAGALKGSDVIKAPWE